MPDNKRIFTVLGNDTKVWTIEEWSKSGDAYMAANPKAAVFEEFAYSPEDVKEGDQWFQNGNEIDNPNHIVAKPSQVVPETEGLSEAKEKVNDLTQQAKQFRSDIRTKIDYALDPIGAALKAGQRITEQKPEAKAEQTESQFMQMNPEIQGSAPVMTVRSYDYWGNKRDADNARIKEIEEQLLSEPENAALSGELEALRASVDSNPRTVEEQEWEAQNTAGGYEAALKAEKDAKAAYELKAGAKHMELSRIPGWWSPEQKDAEIARINAVYDPELETLKKAYSDARSAVDNHNFGKALRDFEEHKFDLQREDNAKLREKAGINMVSANKGLRHKYANPINDPGDSAGWMQIFEMLQGEDPAVDMENARMLEQFNAADNYVTKAERLLSEYSTAGEALKGLAMDQVEEWGSQSDKKTYLEIAGIFARLENALKEKDATLDDITEEDIENNLTLSEQALIRSFFLYCEAAELAEKKQTTWYKGARIAGEMVPFMLEFLVTGGVGTLAGKGATKGLAKAFASWIKKSAKKSAARAAKRYASRAIVGTTKFAVKGATMTALRPSAYEGVAEAMTRIKDDGTLAGAEEFVDAIWDQGIETWSEMLGEKFLGFTKWGTKALGNAKWVQGLADTRWAKWGKAIGEKAVMQKIGRGISISHKFLKPFGVQNSAVELLEEFAGAGMREAIYDPKALDHMFEGNNFESMLLGFSVMPFIGGTVGVGAVGYHNYKAAQLAENIRLSMMPMQSEAQVNHLFSRINSASSAAEMREVIEPVIEQLRENKASIDEIAAVVEYAQEVATYKTLLFVNQAEENGLAEEKRKEAETDYGEFWIKGKEESAQEAEVNEGVPAKELSEEEAEKKRKALDAARKVRIAKLNNGHMVFILSEKPNEAGEYGVIDMSNKRRFYIKESDIATKEDAKGKVVPIDKTWTMDQFLTTQVLKDRQDAEKARMQSERKAQVDALKQEVQADNKLNLGTEESPVWVPVQSISDNGVSYVDANGETLSLTWEQVGNALHKPITVLTDKQIAEQERQRLIDMDQKRMAKHGQRQAVREGLNSKERWEAKKKAKNIPKNPDGTVDETSFWNNDPEGYAEWNDELNQDGGKDTREQIAISLKELKKRRGELEKEANTSDPVKRKAAKIKMAEVAKRYATVAALELKYRLQPRIDAWDNAIGKGRIMRLYTLEELAQYGGREAVEQMSNPFQRVRGFARGSMGFVYMPNIRSVEEYDEVMQHEVLAHLGLKELLGEEQFNALLDEVWKMMPEDAKKRFSTYANVGSTQNEQERQRVAADEYIAHLAEKMDTSEFAPAEKTIWQKIVEFIKNIFRAKGVIVEGAEPAAIDAEGAETQEPAMLTDAQIEDYIRRSYKNLAENKGTPITAKVGFRKSAAEEASSAARQEYDALLSDLTPEEAKMVANNDLAAAQEAFNALAAKAPRVEPGESSKAFIERKRAYAEQLNAAKVEMDAKQALIDEIAAIEAENAPVLTEEEYLDENGFEVDEKNEDVRFSVRFIPTEEQRQSIINSIVKVTGRSEEEATRWLDSETSLAAMVNDDLQYLDYVADPKYKAIKDNSDYPQGTVDFNNICRKRVPFTRMFTRLQRRFPNRVFTADNLADIRTIMTKDGLTVACGLCYVEDRRQMVGEVAQSFIDNMQDGFKSYADNPTKARNAEKFRNAIGADTYVPQVYDLTTQEGLDKLYNEHRGVWEAFQAYNNARGQQSQNLLQGYAEYKREILGWSDKKVKSVNDNGGLRIFSYSDFEAHHLLDVVQIIIDCAAKGVKIQGYTKVPEFARAVANTGIKLNRSLIPLGDTGMVDGQLAFDPVEGIDVNDPNFLESNDNVGNILIGINDEQIRMAMKAPFVHYIIPYHARQKENIRQKLNVGAWTNYISTQNERNISDGKRVKDNINIYTDILNGEIANDRQFVEKYLELCAEKGRIPKFDQFLNKDAEGNYVYTPGYYKFLVDFKLFDENGNILPQQPVVAEFDDAFNMQILEDYAKGEREATGDQMNETYDKIVDALGLDESTAEGEDVRFSVISPEMDADYLAAVESGDMETAQRMVLEAAKLAMPNTKVVDENGNPLVVYHGTGTDFNMFDENYSSTNTGAKNGTLGFYFTPLRSYAETIVDGDSIIKSVFLNIENPLELGYAKKFDGNYHNGREAKPFNYEDGRNVVDGLEAIRRAVTKKFGSYTRENVSKWKSLVESYYDGVFVMTGDTADFLSTLIPSMQYIAFNPSQIKSADPVTYDDAGNVIPLSERFNPENSDIRFSARTDEQREKLFADAKAEFGLTDNFNVAGYMLPDGSLLNFGDPANPTTRAEDHRAIEGVIMENGTEYDSRWMYLADFMNEGAIRLLPEYAGINLMKAPTKEQRSRLFDFIYKYNGEVILEIADERLNNVAYVEYDRRTSPSRIFRDIDGYFNEGIVPQQDVRFSVGPRESSMEEMDELFEKYNTNETAAAIYDKVSALAKTLDLKIRFEKAWSRAAGETFADKVKLNVDFMESPFNFDQQKAHAILHELIHSVTSYAMQTKKVGWLTPEMTEAITQIENIYEMVKADEDFKGMYAQRNASDMIAELHDAAFRNQLKEKNLFQKIVDAIKKLLGFEGSNALEDLDATFNYILDNFDYDAYSGFVRAAQKQDNYIRFSIANSNQTVFVSNAAKAVESIKQEKATPAQWLAMLEKNGGLKAAEDKWMGLSDWLKASDKKTLTKQEVLDFINENMIQIEEVHYDMNADDRASNAHSNIVEVLQNKFNDYVAEYHEEHGYDDEYDDPASKYAIEKLREEMEDTFPYTIELVYGSEVYVTFDYEEENEMVKWAEKTGVDYIPGENPINSTRLNYTTDGLENKHEIALTVPTIESWNEEDEVHFGDAGDGRAVAWIRFGETTDKSGNRILVIDEIQSKRHQEGRDKGYSSDFENSAKLQELNAELEKKTARRKELKDYFDSREENELVRLAQIDMELDEVTNVRDYDRLVAERDEINKREENALAEFDMLANQINELEYEIRREKMFNDIKKQTAIPDAPFEKNWHELAMKRMLRYAAENGYDVIAWTKGEQQAERYNIGGVISEIKATKYPRGYEVVSFGNNGNVVHNEVFADENAMAEVYGIEMSQKIIESVDALESSETATISGDDLKIGGEGMKGFYDKMLPAFMNKYGKKWGIKVEDIDLPNLDYGLTMHSVLVTEEMKASVMEGQVMFSIGNNAETQAMNAKQTKAVGGLLSDEQLGLDEVRFSISKNNRATIDKWLGMRSDLSEAEKNAFMLYIDNREPVQQLAMARWFSKGAIRLPEDLTAIDNAFKFARKMNVDPMKYDTPAAVNKDYVDRFGEEKKEDSNRELLSPDDARFEGVLTNKVDYGNGIVVYDVQNDIEHGQRAVRDLMNDHLGADFNCWCLLYADSKGNPNKGSREMWWHYNKTQKKVAFKDGKICAFCASTGRSSEWWDLHDQSHGKRIPVEAEVEGDKLGRRAFCEFDGKNISPVKKAPMYRGNKKNGLYEEWDNSDPNSITLRTTRKGGKDNGTKEMWDGKGNLTFVGRFKNGNAIGEHTGYASNGQVISKRTYDKDGALDGEVLKYAPNGTLLSTGRFVHGKPVGKHLSYHENGRLMSEKDFQDGHKVGYETEYNKKGKLVSRKYHDMSVGEDGSTAIVTHDDNPSGPIEKYDKFDAEGNLIEHITIEEVKSWFKTRRFITISKDGVRVEYDSKLGITYYSDKAENVVLSNEYENPKKKELYYKGESFLFNRGKLNEDLVDEDSVGLIDEAKAKYNEIIQKQEARYEEMYGSIVSAINEHDSGVRFSVSITPEVRAEMDVIKATAFVDGKLGLAPNGMKSKLDDDQWALVRTKNFKNWFGDWENDPENASKVVDENGEPMVMYHGSAWEPLVEPKGKAVFRMNDGLLGKGAYFSNELAEATLYAEMATGLDTTEEGNYELLQDKYVTDYFLNVRNEEDIFRDGNDMVAVAKSPSQIKSATDNTGEFSESGDIRFSAFRPVGGNRGYVGYSMSKRAAAARAEGRFPKTDFKKEYGVTDKALDLLVYCDIISGSEWHHTSVYGNKTTFYGWYEDEYADIYTANKKEVDAIAREYKKADEAYRNHGKELHERLVAGEITPQEQYELGQQFNSNHWKNMAEMQARIDAIFNPEKKDIRFSAVAEAEEVEPRFSMLPVEQEIKAVRGLSLLDDMGLSFIDEINMIRDAIKAETGLLKKLDKVANKTPLVQQQIENAKQRLEISHRQLEILQEVEDHLIDTTPIEPDLATALEDMEPHSIKEFLADFFTMRKTPVKVTKVKDKDGNEVTVKQGGKKNGVMLDPETLEKELGWSRSDWKGLSYIVSAKEGLSIDKIAEMIAEDENAKEFFSNMDTMQIKDEVIDFLQSIGSYADIRDYIKKERVRMAQEEADYANGRLEEMAEGFEQQNGMSVEEYNEMLIQEAKEAREKWLAEAENPEAFNNFVNESNADYGTETSGQEGSVEEGMENAEGEQYDSGSSSVLEDDEDLPEGDSRAVSRGDGSPEEGGDGRIDDSGTEAGDSEPAVVSEDVDTSRLTVEEVVNTGKQRALKENAEAANVFMKKLMLLNGAIGRVRSQLAAQREYDQETVKIITSLANNLLEDGRLSNMTRSEIKRLLSVIKDAVGKKDLSISVDRLMDIMISNQLRFGKSRFAEFMKIKGKKVDSRGVEVQGKLDLEGQRVMGAMKEGINLDAARLNDRIGEAEDKLFDESETVRRNAELDLAGYEMARQYLENIKESEAEEKDLRKELKNAKEAYDNGQMSAEQYREFVKSTYDAIRENRMQRVMAYENLLDGMAGVVAKSVTKAQQLREAEKQRIQQIQHFANSDMQGMPASAHKPKKGGFWNNPVVRFFLNPLTTFDQMLRQFGRKSPNGEGYLWNHFMRGWLTATENEYTGFTSAMKALDEKVSSVFGRKMRWSDLYSIDGKMPKGTVSMWDDDKMVDYEVTQGNLLYIYMVNKMTDGKMKLRKMGITEEDVDKIKDQMDPRFLQLADWLQGDFLPGLRDKYNAVHEEMFGAPMAAIDNYFPLKVLANARVREQDVNTPETDARPSTITGSIMKRTKNSLALDVLGSNAFDVVVEHLQQMEHWAAFAKYNRDLNTLLSYKKFRNRVQNMSGLYGTGTAVWDNFRKAAEIAVGAYKPATRGDMLDKAITNIAKGVTGAKISFRVYTAIKQLLSMPAFISDANVVELTKSLATPWVSWNWAMQNLPLFHKRWKSRMAGDSRLMETEADWKMWKNKIVELAGKYGMTPNAFIDALTVSIGAKAIYETRKKQYIGRGYSEEAADQRAKQDATILFNESQQSNEGAFLAPVQVDRTAAAVAFTIFRNSSMGYQRMFVDALRNLKHMLTDGHEQESVAFLAKQMIRDGVDNVDAIAAAQKMYNKALFKNAMRLATFGFVVQFAWNLGSYLPYLIVGDDDDEKDAMIKDAAVHGLLGGPIEGLAAGSIMSEMLNMLAKGETFEDYDPTLLPLMSDLKNLWKTLSKDKVAGATDMFNLIAQSVVGVNPQTITDVAVAIYDACHGDPETSKEVALLIMRILQCPQSQIEKVYLDEIDFTVDEALDLTIEQLAKRYAQYKVLRGAPLLGWTYGDDERSEKIGKLVDRFTQKAEELKRTRGNETAKAFYQYYDNEYEDVTKTLGEYAREIELASYRDQDEKKAALKDEFRLFRTTEDFYEYKQLKKYIDKYEDKRKQMKDAVDPEVRRKKEKEMYDARDAMVAMRKELKFLQPYIQKISMLESLIENAKDNPEAQQAYREEWERTVEEREKARQEYRARQESSEE